MKRHGKKRSPFYGLVFLLLLTNLIIGCELMEWETNQAPLGHINLPVSHSEFDIGAPIVFEGLGMDEENGYLTGDMLVWVSDIDGEIGTGESFSRDDLSAGYHTITLFVTDSNDATDDLSVEIEVKQKVLGRSKISYNVSSKPLEMNQVKLILSTSRNFNGKNLSNLNLSRKDLSNCSFRGALLTNTNLKKANLTNADLSNADLSQALFTKANLNKVNFAGIELKNVNFSGADLSNADLSYLVLSGALWRNIKLENANLSHSDLRNIDLRGANLIGANLMYADLTAADSNQGQT